MNHHGASFGNNDSNCSLRNTILPLSTNAAEANGLKLVSQLFSESFALVDTVVCVVGINCNAQFMRVPFKVVLGIDGVTCIQSHLVFHMDVT